MPLRVPGARCERRLLFTDILRGNRTIRTNIITKLPLLNCCFLQVVFRCACKGQLQPCKRLASGRQAERIAPLRLFLPISSPFLSLSRSLPCHRFFLSSFSYRLRRASLSSWLLISRALSIYSASGTVYVSHHYSLVCSWHCDVTLSCMLLLPYSDPTAAILFLIECSGLFPRL